MGVSIYAPERTAASNAEFAPQLKGPSSFVPLKQGEDGLDPKRLALLKSGWDFYNELVRVENRQIEENVRMIAGQQSTIFHPVIGRWLDPSEWMSAEERQYRSRPTFNRLLPWFLIQHARVTENTPIVTFVPGPDRMDAELAEVLDTATKSVWYEANMEEAHDRLMGWVLAAGSGYLLSRINPNGGPMREWVGSDIIPVVDAYDQPVPDGDGGQAMMPAKGVPFDRDGKPLAMWRMTAPGAGELVKTGAPHKTRVGAIEVEVLSPMQVRSDWGPTPFYRKRRHWIKTYLTPEQVYDLTGQDVPPDVRGGQATDVGELERLMYGTGFYGATWGLPESQTTATKTDGYCEVTQLWEAPCSYGGLEETEQSPGGRWLMATRTRVLRDGVRPAAFPFTSPLHRFEFIRLPGRGGGTTLVEALNPVQRSLNDRNGRINDHVNLSTNPIGIIDAQAGLGTRKFTNRPGQNYVMNIRPNVKPIDFAAPPQLGDDVYKSYGLLSNEFATIGFTSGAEEQSNPGDSGEKVREVRFNTDRFLGPTMRRVAGEYGRMYQTWRALMPLVWDMETTISYAGDDQIAQTITVFPEMFKGGVVNVRPDVESMQPEGLAEKRERVAWAYSQGLLGGKPGDPKAVAKFWDLARFPHLARLAKPNSIDYTTAEQENGQLLQGVPAVQIPVYEWYDDDAHLAVLERFMKSPEFKKLAPPIKDQFVLHRQAHQFNAEKKQMAAASKLAQLQMLGGPPGGGPPGPGGRPGAPSGPNGGPGNPAAAPSTRPQPPQPPKGAPGGVTPTAAGAAPATP